MSIRVLGRQFTQGQLFNPGSPIHPRSLPAEEPEPFWKANYNQMAMPGMEHMAHAGAHALAQGYYFRHEDVGGRLMTLSAFHPETFPELKTWRPGNPQWPAATLEWGQHKSPVNEKGEIAWVESNVERSGLPTALYGLGRQMANVQPEHSSVRTSYGNRWAHKVSKIHGGKVPRRSNDYDAEV